MEKTVKSYAEELREQEIDDILIENYAHSVASIVRIRKMSIDEAIVDLDIKEHLVRDVRYLAEKELQKEN